MSINHALSNALSGLNAASRMAEVVASNLANATTEGYGRRRLDLSPVQIGGRGGGVRVDGITRLVDRGLLADRRHAGAALAGADTMASALGRLESLVGEIDDPLSIAGRITALEEALAAAATDPSSETRLGQVVTRLGEVATAIRSASGEVQDVRIAADRRIADGVDLLNSSLEQVAELNADITRAINTGGDASALLDPRQVVVDRISELVPVREMDRPGGQIALVSVSGQILLDGSTPPVFGFDPSPVIEPGMTLAAGDLSGITLDGAPLGTDGVGKLGGGTLAASFALRDRTMTALSGSLDALAADLIARFEDPATDPTLGPGMPGLLTDAGAALGGPVAGLADRIAVNAAVDPAQGGDLWRLRDGVGAATAGPVGDATQLFAWSDALSAQRPSEPGGALRSAGGHAAAWLSDVGVLRLNADDAAGFATAGGRDARCAMVHLAATAARTLADSACGDQAAMVIEGLAPRPCSAAADRPGGAGGASGAFAQDPLGAVAGSRRAGHA